MELFNKSGVLLASVLVMVGALIACQAKEDAVPPAPVIEAVAQKLNENGGAAAERRLREWADQGSVVAKRELGMLYQSKNTRPDEALRLFEEAAKGGDSESAFRLAEMYRAPAAGGLAEQAPPHYAQAAHRHARPEVTLASLRENRADERLK
jgi:TPR repeat protein